MPNASETLQIKESALAMRVELCIFRCNEPG